MTKEQTFELDANAVSTASVMPPARRALVVVWAGDGHRSVFHPGWLRAHRYDGDAAEPDTDHVGCLNPGHAADVRRDSGARRR